MDKNNTKSWMKKERVRAEKEKANMRRIQHEQYAESQKEAKRIAEAKKKKDNEERITAKKNKAKAKVEKRKIDKKTTKKKTKKTKKVRTSTKRKIAKARTAAKAFKNIFGN